MPREIWNLFFHCWCNIPIAWSETSCGGFRGWLDRVFSSRPNMHARNRSSPSRSCCQWLFLLGFFLTLYEFLCQQLKYSQTRQPICTKNISDFVHLQFLKIPSFVWSLHQFSSGFWQPCVRRANLPSRFQHTMSQRRQVVFYIRARFERGFVA